MAANGDHKMNDVESSDSPHNSTMENELHQVLTKTASISPELFEKIYLQPRNQVKGDLRKTFGNPTPVALVGFTVGLTPLSVAFMGWRGAGGNAIATTTATLFFGGSLLTIAGLLEFILGNTFPFVVFMGYGAHFITYGTTFIPFFNAAGYFSGTATNMEVWGPPMVTPEFAVSYAFYPLCLGCLSFIYLICSIRTNVVFVIIFVFATIGFGLATGAFYYIHYGNMVLSNRLLVGTGACFFGASMMGWYLLLAIMMVEMDLPLPELPVGDLSTVIKGKKQLKAAKGQ